VLPHHKANKFHGLILLTFLLTPGKVRQVFYNPRLQKDHFVRLHPIFGGVPGFQHSFLNEICQACDFKTTTYNNIVSGSLLAFLLETLLQDRYLWLLWLQILGLVSLSNIPTMTWLESAKAPNKAFWWLPRSILQLHPKRKGFSKNNGKERRNSKYI